MIKKRYNLVGIDGNAHCIMNYCIKAMKECKKQKEEIEAYRKKLLQEIIIIYYTYQLV